MDTKRRDSGRQQPHEPNPIIACACGCGELFPKFDESGRPRAIVTGHNTSQGADGRLTPKTLAEVGSR